MIESEWCHKETFPAIAEEGETAPQRHNGQLWGDVKWLLHKTIMIRPPSFLMLATFCP